MYKKCILVISLVLFGTNIFFAQKSPPEKTIKSSSQTIEVSREKREQAYAKLLEGQRYIWGMSRDASAVRNLPSVSTANMKNEAQKARAALEKAVELDPNLAEAYTALADLAWNMPPNDIDEAIKLAGNAVKIDSDNFGARQILARLYTFKSKVSREDNDFAAKAINEWKQIVRLDPRNAEAYAFLSGLYVQTNQTAERIDALRKWLSAAAPIDTRFYRFLMSKDEPLTSETAALKLGEALVEAGENREAVEVLSRAVADSPDNLAAIEQLRVAVESADDKSVASAISALEQAVFANPENPTLITLLAQVQARSGNLDEAEKLLGSASRKLSQTDQVSASILQITLGDIYFDSDRFDQAVAVYQNALAMRGLDKNELIGNENRRFAAIIYEKIIQAYKSANRPDGVENTIERARRLFGEDDLFSDQQMLSFYMESGKREQALQSVRALRTNNPNDSNLLRTEASILTDLGRVDEAVALVKDSMNRKNNAGNSGRGSGSGVGSGTGSGSSRSSVSSIEFSNYWFISTLYSQAKRGKEAIQAANSAIAVAGSPQEKQIAELTLATAQQTAGDFTAAEKTLRDLLKQTPGNPIALNNLGYFLVERNEKLEEALDLIKQALESDPKSSSYLDSLGWAYFKLNKLDEAEKYLKSAVRYDSSSATIFEHLGDIYQKKGNIESAEFNWKKALKLAADAEDVQRLKKKLNIK